MTEWQLLMIVMWIAGMIEAVLTYRVWLDRRKLKLSVAYMRALRQRLLRDDSCGT